MQRVGARSGHEISAGAPLWLDLLAEADQIGRPTAVDRFDEGGGLGPVGARIVPEALIGLLEREAVSDLGADRNGRPGAAYDSVGKMLASTPFELP